jgi:nitrogen regulatory protein PII-like uncharacterized protein
MYERNKLMTAGLFLLFAVGALAAQPNGFENYVASEEAPSSIKTIKDTIKTCYRIPQLQDAAIEIVENQNDNSVLARTKVFYEIVETVKVIFVDGAGKITSETTYDRVKEMSETLQSRAWQAGYASWARKELTATFKAFYTQRENRLCANK